jgi:polyferredoxin
MSYALFADLILVLHVGFVLFVVGGLVLIVLGNLRHWQWVNHWWFRLVHLGTIAAVVAETWLGWVCPLTTLEQWLRVGAGDTSYSGGFIEHWLQQLLYYDAPTWVFLLGYSLFGLLVLASWWLFPPTARPGKNS